MMQRNVMARACVAAGVLILAACGGGGGADTPAATGGDAPLSLSPSNAAQASVEAMGFGGVALGLGQQAVDWIAAADAAGGDVVTTTCVSGGTQTVTLNDLDGNHRVSAGDRLLVQMNNCFLPPLDDAFDGTLTIDVAVPIAPLQQAGTITFGSVFDVRVAGGSVRLGGGLRYEYAADRLAKSVRVASNTSSFTITAYSGTRTIAAILTRLDATRTVRRDTARSTTTMQYHLASDALGGAVEVATSVPWSAWFDSYPDAGELSLIGAGATSASLRASSQGGALFEVRAGGALAGTVTAYEASSGYLWSGTGWVTQSNVLPGSSYNIWEASSIGFKQFSQPLVAVLQPSPGPLTWGYSRPLAAGTLTSATFVQTRLPPGQNGAPVNIPATLNIEGALLSVTPMTQLEPGAAYELVFDNSYLVPVSDTTGATAPRPSLSATVALTIAASARIDGPAVLLGSSATVTLDASASTAPGSSIMSTRWRQLSGPALSISGADTARAVVTLVGSGGDNGEAVVELEVRNAAGDYDREQLRFQVYADLSQVLVIAHRAGSAALTVDARTVVPGQSGPYVRYYPASNNTVDVYSGGPRLLAGLPAGTVWQAGVDLTYAVPPGVGGANILWMPLGSFCFGATGHLAVLDYAAQSDGNVTRFAVDFEQTCDGESTFGSIRYNSAVALRF